MQNNDYNRGGYIAFLFSMAFSLLFFIYVTVVHPGIDLKEVSEQPVDQTLAGGPAFDVNAAEKPWVSSEEMIAAGKKVYSANCAVCHGEGYLGDGAAGKALTPPPRNLVEGKWTKGGDSIALFNTLANGIPGTSMASFAHLKVNERWALVHLIQSVTKNPVKDDAAKVEAFAKTAK
jgi:mono/diheme cytochrome c family protein